MCVHFESSAGVSDSVFIVSDSVTNNKKHYIGSYLNNVNTLNSFF